jgi:NAD-dependent SIR2 family protein deacetylase
MTPPPLDVVARTLSRARRIVVLTGAGMSAPSGVPTFRGAGGLWRTHRAEDLATPEAFARDPETVWQWYDWRRQQIAACLPNAGHHVLARWSTALEGLDVFTQNVDGLHELAGTRRLQRLHGSIWWLRCVRASSGRRPTAGGCSQGASREVREVPLAPLPPRCPCGALLRPDVVWFGESLDPEIIAAAEHAAAQADVLLAIGTSAQVYPAAGLIPRARAAGALSVEINPDASAADVDVRLAMGADEALVALDQRLSGSASV